MKLKLIMLKYQNKNCLPEFCEAVQELCPMSSFMACFFYNHCISTLAIEAGAVLRDPRCLNERCPVLGQGS